MIWHSAAGRYSAPANNGPDAEMKLLASAALKAAYLELLPQFEMATGHKVTAAWSSSRVIQQRVAAGEIADIVIMANILGTNLTDRKSVV